MGRHPSLGVPELSPGVLSPETALERYNVPRRLFILTAVGRLRDEAVSYVVPNGGWRVIEMWESEEDAKRFVKERLGPAFEAVGAPLPPPPQFWPVHNYMA